MVLGSFGLLNQGGMPGSERLRDCKALHRMLEKQIEEKRPVAAICAAPVVVLHAHGWLKVVISLLLLFL
jgi:putative intracellular protease/amidase